MGVRGQLSVPSVVLGAEMAGASLYGSFRAGLEFGSGDASVSNYGSRWGIKGSHEVSEGLTASYKYEGTLDMTNAEAFGGAGHSHDASDDTVFVDQGGDNTIFSSTGDGEDPEVFENACMRGDPFTKVTDDDDNVTYKPLGDTDQHTNKPLITTQLVVM